jgi:hypothetical protein
MPLLLRLPVAFSVVNAAMYLFHIRTRGWQGGAHAPVWYVDSSHIVELEVHWHHCLPREGGAVGRWLCSFLLAPDVKVTRREPRLCSSQSGLVVVDLVGWKLM